MLALSMLPPCLLVPSCDKSITGDIDPPTRSSCSRESGAEAVAASLAAPKLPARTHERDSASALAWRASRANYRPTALPSDSGLNPRPTPPSVPLSWTQSLVSSKKATVGQAERDADLGPEKRKDLLLGIYYASRSL